MTDLLIYESGNGGELLLRGNDLAGVNGYENAGYLAQFGGAEWWGNYMTDQPYNSQTEIALQTNALSSAGRLAIEQAIKADLEFLKDISGTTATVQTSIAGVNRLDSLININGKQFYLQYNPDSMFLKYSVGG